MYERWARRVEKQDPFRETWESYKQYLRDILEAPVNR